MQEKTREFLEELRELLVKNKVYADVEIKIGGDFIILPREELEEYLLNIEKELNKLT